MRINVTVSIEGVLPGDDKQRKVDKSISWESFVDDWEDFKARAQSILGMEMSAALTATLSQFTQDTAIVKSDAKPRKKSATKRK